ncbi:MAG: GLUG motif-containing protein [Rhizomicrobium sp.]
MTISSAATKDMSCTSGVCTPTSANAVLNVSDLTTMLASGNVSVNTGSGSLAKQVKNIDVSAGFSWASGSSLTLDAYDSVNFNKAVSVAGSGAVALTTNDGGKSGALWFGPKGSLSFLDTGNSLTIDGKAYTLVNTVASLASDIDAKPSGNFALSANYNAKPDGAYSTAPVATTFEGNFNGLGNTISNLTISTKVQNLTLGLFADVDTPASVSSIRVTDAKIKAAGNSYIGLLVGSNSGSLINSYSQGTITSAAGKNAGSIGGLVGFNEGNLNETAAAVKVLVNGKSPGAIGYLGGLVGDNGGQISSSYATGSATASDGVGVAFDGGLVGYNAEFESLRGIITNCYATGAVSIGARTYVGGLVGENAWTISNSYSTGAPTANGALVGGSMGDDQGGPDGGTVSDNYWDTTTSGITNLSQGAGNIANDPGIAGETTAQFGLPYLIANPPQ